MTSLASAKGPSVTITFPPETRTRAPSAVGPSPPLPSIVPAFVSSSAAFAIASISSLGGGPCFSVCLTIIMNRIVRSPLLVLVGKPIFRAVSTGRNWPLYMRRTVVGKIDTEYEFFAPQLALLRGHLSAHAFFPFPELWGQLGTEIIGLEHLSNFYLRFALKWIRATLHPFNSFF